MILRPVFASLFRPSYNKRVQKSIEAGVACLRKGDPSMDQIVRVDGKASVKRIPNKDHLAVQLSTHCNIFRNRKKYDRAAEKDRLVKDGTEF
jgi:hypothetical protein